MCIWRSRSLCENFKTAKVSKCLSGGRVRPEGKSHPELELATSSFSSRHLSLRMNATAIIHYDVRRWVTLLRIHPCTLCLQHVAPPATRPAKQAGMRNLRERDRWRSLHSMSGVHAVWRRDRTVWVFARVRRQNVDCFRVLMNNFSFLYSWYITV